MTIRTRLAITYAVAVATTLAVVGFVVWGQFGLALREARDDQLVTRLSALENAIENEGELGLQEGDGDDRGVFVGIVGPDGSVVDASAWAPSPIAIDVVEGAPQEISIQGHRYLVRTDSLGDNLRIVAGVDLAELERSQASLAGLLGVAGALATLLSGIGGWLLAGRALGPVAQLTAEAAAIGASDLDRRLPEPRRTDELGVLARTLNRMLDRLASTVRRQQAFVAAASHDLRTPLAALQAELELADRLGTDAAELRAAIRAARDDAARLAELAGDLLQLASVSGGGRELVRTVVDAGDVVDAVARRTAPVAEGAGVTIIRRIDRGRISVDRVRLEQALANLLINAITYSPPGGEVEVVGQAPAGGAEFSLEVLDRGPGVRPDAVETIFEPFQRGDGARGRGAGLGLATARAAVQAHGATLTVEPRAGGGAVFAIRFPNGVWLG
ncbi:MAG: ATP-binding protein [Chloroflexota bacterium]